MAVGSVTPVLIGTGFGGIAPAPPPEPPAHHRPTPTPPSGPERSVPLAAADLQEDLRRPDPRVEQPQRHHRLRRPGDRRPHVPPASHRRPPPPAGPRRRTTPPATRNDHLTFKRRAGPRSPRPWSPGPIALVSLGPDYWTNLDTDRRHLRRLSDPAGRRQHLELRAAHLQGPLGLQQPRRDQRDPRSGPPSPPPSANDGLEQSRPRRYLFGSVHYRVYSRINVANAIAAIEGDDRPAVPDRPQRPAQYIDANKDGLITAQEIQNFVDNVGDERHARGRRDGPAPGRTARPPTATSTTALRRAARPARRPPAPVQLLRLRRRRPSSTARSRSTS